MQLHDTITVNINFSISLFLDYGTVVQTRCPSDFTGDMIGNVRINVTLGALT
jgi:hypothetical protein